MLDHRDLFSVLRVQRASVNNKPIDTTQSVITLGGSIVERFYQIQDSSDSATETVESEIYIDDLGFRFNLDDQLRQVSCNQRWRIIKVFYRIQRTCLWVARSDMVN